MKVFVDEVIFSGPHSRPLPDGPRGPGGDHPGRPWRRGDHPKMSRKMLSHSFFSRIHFFHFFE